MEKTSEKIIVGVGVAVVALGVVILVAAITSIITLLAWNTIMPHAFHLPTINIWQAFAFNLLAGQFRSTFTTKK